MVQIFLENFLKLTYYMLLMRKIKHDKVSGRAVASVTCLIT